MIDNLTYLKDKLTIDDIEEIMTSLGAEPRRRNDIIINRTVCHCGDSHKLYYYDNTKLFKCYTRCGDNIDIFSLVQRVKEQAGEIISLPQAIRWVSNFCNIPLPSNDFSEAEERILPDKDLFIRWENSLVINQEEEKPHEFSIIDKNIIKHLPKPHIIPWEEEDIDYDVMIDRGICYDPINQCIIIPHYDINDNLIGIRSRTMIAAEEKYGKYVPSHLFGQMFNHPLGLNLYNINKSKDNIAATKTVIIYESEKSCLKYASYFGVENDISVAVCGNNFTKFQFNILKSLGVQNIIIAYDRQYHEVGDEEWIKWTEKYVALQQKYGNEVLLSFIVDREHLLNYKDSPIDCGKETFLELFKHRETAF